MRFLAIVSIVAMSLPAQQSKPAAPKADETDPKNPVWDLRAKKNEDARFFQIGPAKDDREPKDGYRLLLVLPGGDGGADFMPWCRNIRANVLGGDWIVADLVSMKWKTPANTWPTKLSPVPKMEFTTEEFAAGAYVAMAVFHPREMPPLKAAKGRSWFLDHSPEDDRCPFKDAETARDALTAAGGKVELVTYKGGRGWHDDPLERMRKGIKFLEDHASGKK